MSGLSVGGGKQQPQGPSSATTSALRPPMRRKVTGEVLPPPTVSMGVGVPRNVLSPLNPRARQSGLLPSGLNPQSVGAGQGQAKQPQLPRTLNVNKKP